MAKPRKPQVNLTRLEGALTEALTRASRQAVQRVGERVLHEALGDVPYKTGELARSGKVEVHRLPGPGRRYEAVVSFGDEGDKTGKYAGVQEQGFVRRNGKKIRFKHYTTPGTGPHYLENALDRNAKRLQTELLDQSREEIRKLRL